MNEQIRYFFQTVLKTNLFVRFSEEFEDTKKSFRNYLTFSMYWLYRLCCKEFRPEKRYGFHSEFFKNSTDICIVAQQFWLHTGPLPLSICIWFLTIFSLKFWLWWIRFFPGLNWIFDACVAYQNLVQTRYFKLENANT